MSHPDAKGYLLHLGETQADVKKTSVFSSLGVRSGLDVHSNLHNFMAAGDRTAKQANIKRSMKKRNTSSQQ